jgi:hypothetical protein
MRQNQLHYNLMVSANPIKYKIVVFDEVHNLSLSTV